MTALRATEHMGIPNTFRTAICFDVLAKIGSKFPRFEKLIRTLLKETQGAVYLTPNELVDSPSTITANQSQRVAAMIIEPMRDGFARPTYFTKLQEVLEEKRALESDL